MANCFYAIALTHTMGTMLYCADQREMDGFRMTTETSTNLL
jgi:hypothetical protein